MDQTNGKQEVKQLTDMEWVSNTIKMIDTQIKNGQAQIKKIQTQMELMRRDRAQLTSILKKVRRKY